MCGSKSCTSNFMCPKNYEIVSVKSLVNLILHNIIRSLSLIRSLRLTRPFDLMFYYLALQPWATNWIIALKFYGQASHHRKSSHDVLQQRLFCICIIISVSIFPKSYILIGIERYKTNHCLFLLCLITKVL